MSKDTHSPSTTDSLTSTTPPTTGSKTQTGKRTGLLSRTTGVRDKEPHPPFYSGMDRAIAEMAPFSKSGEIDAKMLGHWLEARTKDGLIKRDELEWTGLGDYLKTQNVGHSNGRSQLVAIGSSALSASNAVRVRSFLAWNSRDFLRGVPIHKAVFATVACLFVAVAQLANAAGAPAKGAAENETFEQCKARLGNALDCFHNQAVFAFTICKLRMKITLMQSSRDFFSCSREQRKAMEPYYAGAAKALAKKPAALSLLKETYAYWQTSIDGLIPQVDERKIVYEQRIGKREEGLDERLNRLQLEK